MTHSQEDRLDRIQHTLLLNTEKISSKSSKNADFRSILWVDLTYETIEENLIEERIVFELLRIIIYDRKMGP